MSQKGKGNVAIRSKSGLDKAKEKIFFEKQEGRLCGQHCLNNALQSRLFDAVDLSTIAQSLDEEERKTMAEHGTHTKEYKDFINKPSSNYDDSGYFSIQVLSQALRNVNLDLINWKSDDERATKARKFPAEERLFICHMDDHWLSLRRFGPQWVNLNSMLKGPELLTDTYLAIYLQTMQTEGYTIFVVFGELLECEADQLFSALRRTEDGKYVDELPDPGHRLGSSTAGDDDGLLRRGSDSGTEESLSKAEAIRRQREQFLQRFSSSALVENAVSVSNSDKIDEKEDNSDKA